MTVSGMIPSLEFENRLVHDGYTWIIGLDEVGRGALAGPVMVGAVAVGIRQLAQESIPQGLADSKLLTHARREGLFEPLQSWASAWSVGSCTNQEIDQWGIGYALGIAALKALQHVEEQLFDVNQQTMQVSQAVLHSENIKKPMTANHAQTMAPCRIAAILDGPFNYIDKVANTFEAPELTVPVHVQTLVKADRKCASVAAAAVLAKVLRDRMMVALSDDPQYAAYEWDHNKGYGSQAHRDAIAHLGPSDLHRTSWHLT